MDEQTVKILCELNKEFYQEHAESFSATRQSPWSGWLKALEATSLCRRHFSPEPRRSATLGSDDKHHLRDLRPPEPSVLTIFDLACGNLRFASFLQETLPDASIEYYAIDNCDALVPSAPAINYQSLDVLKLLQQNERINDYLKAPLCDLSVAFGFMHHVPTQTYRAAVLDALIAQTHPGGYIIVSFWQFMKNEALAAKARITHERALQERGLPELDEGDYLLDWQNRADTYRYCHSFSEAEMDALLHGVAGRAKTVARFTADGRTGDLNTYVILQTASV